MNYWHDWQGYLTVASWCIAGSGDISFEEFTTLAHDGALMHGALQNYEEAFHAAAKDGNSGLTAQELGVLLENLGHPIDEQQLQQALHWAIRACASCRDAFYVMQRRPMITLTFVQAFVQYDINGSGTIEFGEFLRLFRNQFLDLEVPLHPLLPPCVSSYVHFETGSSLRTQEILRYMQRQPQPSADAAQGVAPPGASGRSSALPAAGEVLQLSSTAELDALLQEAGPRLVVLEAVTPVAHSSSHRSPKVPPGTYP